MIAATETPARRDETRAAVVTRTFDAPAALVWDAITKPEHVRAWYGCGSMDVLVCDIDLRVGGAFRYVLRDANGEYAFSGEYLEIVPGERLVNTWQFEGAPGPPAIETATFHALGERTRVEMRIEFPSAEHYAGWAAAGAMEGQALTLDRLGEVVRELADPTVATHVLVATRRFDAPPALVFRAWTDPEHVGQWWGPDGFTTTIHAMDVRPGGVWRYTMHGPDGTDYPNRIAYRAVEPPARLEYDHGEDEVAWNLFHVVVTFDEEDGGTRLTMRLRFPTAEARHAVMGYAVEGGRQTLARLAEHLKTM